MKLKFLPSSGKAAWQNSKPFLWFVLWLLLIHSVLKIIFYYYNHQLIFNGYEPAASAGILTLIKWSLSQDLLAVLGINVFLFFSLSLGKFFSVNISKWIIIPLFVAVNSVAVLLNLVDIFYFRFHLR